MCDPVSLSIASTVAGVAGTAVSSIGAMNAQKKQERNVLQWQREQTQARQQEQARQEQLRQQADTARTAGLEKMTGEAQQKRQSDEEARLAAYLQGGEGSQQATPETGSTAPISIADTAMTGEVADPQDKNLQVDLAKKINDATKNANQRLGALARVSSYGSSFGGLGTENPMIQQETGGNIDMFNEFRRGSMAAYGLKKAIDPVQVTYTPSPLADIFKTVGSIGAYGMGSQAGGGFGTDTSNVFPVAPAASKFQGPPVPLPAYLKNTGGLF